MCGNQLIVFFVVRKKAGLRGTAACLVAAFTLAATLAARAFGQDAPPQPPADISGSWDIEGYGRADIRPCADDTEKFCVYARGMTEKTLKLLKPEGPQCDLEIYRGLEREGDSPRRWSGGDVVNSGQALSGLVSIEVKLSADGQSFKGRGYISWPFPEKELKGKRLAVSPPC